jgi:hydroxymethylpyrimidine/phosphomethylpyrimidine kinase
VADPAAAEPRVAVLLVGGLDPSGGAGIVQDVSVARSLGAHPLTVLTAVAVQNTSRVEERYDLPPRLVRSQLDVLADEFQAGAVKTGLLGSPALVEDVAAWLGERPRLPVVVDPVLAASSGAILGDPGTVRAMAQHLFPRARIVTPNLNEAAQLLGTRLDDRDAVPGAARRLRALGPDWVLITGGHLPRGRSSDFLCGPGTEEWLEEERRTGGPVRGTGCALAAALACGLARGETVPDAARAAKRFVTAGLDRAYTLGAGRFLDALSGPA